MRRRIPQVLFFAALACSLVTPNRLAGQFTTASLSGNVTDQSGASIPDAKVTVTNIDTGFTQIATAGPAGDYLFSRLPVGKYKLTVEKEGLQTYIQSGIELTVNQAATLNVTMSVGAVSQQVTVTGDTSLVTTQSASVGQVVNQRQIVDLPLDGRQVQQLVFLSAGITDATSHYCGSNCEGGTYPGEQYAKASGTFSESINYQMDGVAYNDTYVNTNLPFPNPDAVQEFSVQGTNMSAEYGNAVGGVVNVVTKSGTNQIHGDVFEFLRNGDMNARNFFAPAQDQIKRNQFGGSVGGPILKDHLFYFGTYQGTRYANAAQGQIAFVPTAQERNGDFSDLAGTQITDPTNNNAPFPNNQIPTSRLSSVAQYFLNSIPLPNAGGQEINYLGPSQHWADDQFMLKADYVRGKHQLSVRYFYTNFNQQPFNAKANLLQVDGSGNQVKVQNIAVTHTYNANPHLLFNTWFGWNQQNGGSLSGAPFCPADAGINVVGTKPCELSIGVGGGFGIGSNHYGAFNRGDSTYREDVTWIKGAHEIHFGGEALRIRAPMANTFEENGVFNFNNNLSGNNIADFMLGQVSQFTQAGGLYLNFTGIKWSAFVQDNWRVSSRLTLNLGLRWDPWFPYKDSQGRVGCFEPWAPNPQSQRFPNAPVGLLFGGDHHDADCPSASMVNRPWNFAPRLGFAYRLTDDGKTSVRGGVGTYYAIPNTVAFQDVVGIPPFAPIIFLTDVNFQDPYGSAGVPDPFPGSFGAINKSYPSSTTFPQGPFFFTQIFARDFRLPVIALWNLTLERQLGGSWLVRAAYVGNKGTHLYGTADQESGLFQANPAIYIPGNNPDGTPISTVDNEQSRRKYPLYSNVSVVDSAINSHYNGLQLTVEKRFARGFSMLTNYTLAHDISGFAPIGSYYGPTNPFNRHFDYGPSDEDVRHVFKFSGTYQLPHFGFSGIGDKIVNGWQVSSIVTWEGGFPFTVYSGVDNSLAAEFEDRADFTGSNIHQAQLGSGRSHAAMIQQWIDTALFQPNAIGTFGNMKKNALRGPRLFNNNMALVKNTKITERFGCEFRAEAFNVFNNVNFQLYTSNGGTGLDRYQADQTFGQIFNAAAPRILQLALKLSF
ncbi:MAG TPA: TonB-dependent receptor [Bryobacteraceae bacterium]|nr:TonB-dependent receptor [Bryobacteraceae bacterium]